MKPLLLLCGITDKMGCTTNYFLSQKPCASSLFGTSSQPRVLNSLSSIVNKQCKNHQPKSKYMKSMYGYGTTPIIGVKKTLLRYPFIWPILGVSFLAPLNCPKNPWTLQWRGDSTLRSPWLKSCWQESRQSLPWSSSARVCSGRFGWVVGSGLRSLDDGRAFCLAWPIWAASALAHRGPCLSDIADSKSSWTNGLLFCRDMLQHLLSLSLLQPSTRNLLPETNSDFAPENGCLEDDSFQKIFGEISAYLSGANC